MTARSDKSLILDSYVKIVNDGTSRFPIASRYVGRTARVIDCTAQGRVLKLAIHDRVSPLRAINTSVVYI